MITIISITLKFEWQSARKQIPQNQLQIEREIALFSKLVNTKFITLKKCVTDWDRVTLFGQTIK